MFKPEDVNPQNPFAFQRFLQAERRKKKEPQPHKTHLPSNIKGICIYCGMLFQKIKVHGIKCQHIKAHESSKPCFKPTCAKCVKDVGVAIELVEFPKSSIPWAINPVKGRFTKGHVRFTCQICGRAFFSWAVLGALCDHTAHLPPNFTCRFCCIKSVSADVQAGKLELNANKKRKTQQLKKTLARRYAKYAQYGQINIAPRVVRAANGEGFRFFMDNAAFQQPVEAPPEAPPLAGQILWDGNLAVPVPEPVPEPDPNIPLRWEDLQQINPEPDPFGWRGPRQR